MKYFNKEFCFAVLCLIITYLLFFHSLLNPNNLIWGSDLELKHLPARWYLYDQIVNHFRFPFWTEKAFGGFSIYADSENGYLNIVNVLSVLIFGPVLSIKILHFITYLVGSISLYILTRRLKYDLNGFLIANLIFFFSFFMINHLIHFNMMMIVYLLPLNILLTDYLVEALVQKNKRQSIFFIFINAILITYGFYWGHYQISIIIFLSQILWGLSRLYDKHKNLIWIFVIELMLIGFSAVVFSLPQTLPTMEIYTDSSRSSGDKDVNAFIGAYSPTMYFLTVLPQPWGSFNRYYGKRYNDNFSYTEIYIYLGISIILIGFIAFLFARKNIRFFYYSSYIIFFLLTFLPSIPFIQKDIWLISAFRYWVRSVIILIFANALLIGNFITKNQIEKEIFKIKKNNLINGFLYLIPPIYLLVINFFYPSNYPKVNLFETVYYRNLITSDTAIKMAIVALSVFLVFGAYYIATRLLKFKNALVIFPMLLLVIVFLDLRYFAEDALDGRINKWNIPSVVFSDEIKNKRIVYNTPVILDSQNSQQIKQSIPSIYLSTWSVFGYSQYAPNEFVGEFKNVPLDVSKVGQSRYNNLSNISVLEKFGVIGVYDEDRFYSSGKFYEDVSFIKTNDKIKNLNLISDVEGNLKFEFDLDDSATIDTYIKADRNMIVEINGENTTWTKNEMFLSFEAPKGKNSISLYYYPKLFYFGVVIAFMLFGIFGFLLVYLYYNEIKMRFFSLSRFKFIFRI